MKINGFEIKAKKVIFETDDTDLCKMFTEMIKNTTGVELRKPYIYFDEDTYAVAFEADPDSELTDEELDKLAEAGLRVQEHYEITGVLLCALFDVSDSALVNAYGSDDNMTISIEIPPDAYERWLDEELMGDFVEDVETLGNFYMGSGIAIISDPCYSHGTWCQGTVTNVKKGNWKTQVTKGNFGDWGDRVIRLTASHESVLNNGAPLEINYEELEADIGVDSGQCGIFDLMKFKGGCHTDESEEWYDKCCEKTLNDPSAGVIDGGVVSSSGYGDGSYTAFVARDKNDEVISIMVEFIDDEESEEEEGEVEF